MSFYINNCDVSLNRRTVTGWMVMVCVVAVEPRQWWNPPVSPTTQCQPCSPSSSSSLVRIQAASRE